MTPCRRNTSGIFNMAQLIRGYTTEEGLESLDALVFVPPPPPIPPLHSAWRRRDADTPLELHGLRRKVSAYTRRLSGLC